ncbi:MAG: manganese catalase family protein, partial [Phocaeicola sp.]|nr:manganese catalase family protein [Phocaeicola sp.]
TIQTTNGLLDLQPKGTNRTEKEVRKADEQLAHKRSEEILSVTPEKDFKWSCYPKSNPSVSKPTD